MKIVYGTYKIKTYFSLSNGLDMALSNGIRDFDTAELYQNHGLFGKILPELLLKHNLTRSSIHITTKLSWNTLKKSDDQIVQAINKIFETLGLDYLDLLLIHAPSSRFSNEHVWLLLNSYNLNPINNYGVSNFNVDQIQNLNNYIKLNNLAPIYCNQVELNPHVYLRQKPLIQLCQELNIKIYIYGLYYHWDTYDSISRGELINWAHAHNLIPIISTQNNAHMNSILQRQTTYTKILDTIDFDPKFGFIYTQYNK
jgi:diketogulonate reductase-like aldo/keto reductase